MVAIPLTGTGGQAMSETSVHARRGGIFATLRESLAGIHRGAACQLYELAAGTVRAGTVEALLDGSRGEAPSLPVLLDIRRP